MTNILHSCARLVFEAAEKRINFSLKYTLIGTVRGWRTEPRFIDGPVVALMWGVVAGLTNTNAYPIYGGDKVRKVVLGFWYRGGVDIAKTTPIYGV